jgi:hypothetical protein
LALGASLTPEAVEEMFRYAHPVSLGKLRGRSRVEGSVAGPSHPSSRTNTHASNPDPASSRRGSVHSLPTSASEASANSGGTPTGAASRSLSTALHEHSEEEGLSYREFLVCLAVGSVLHLLPYRAGTPPSPRAAAAGGAGGEGSSSSPAARHAAAAILQAGAELPSASSDPDPSPPAIEPAAEAAPQPPLILPDAPAPDAAPAPRDAAAGHSLHSPASPSRIPTESEAVDFLAHSQHGLALALRLVLEAWVLFDKNGDGRVDKEEVLEIISQEIRGGDRSAVHKAHAQGSGDDLGILSKSRWEELDWSPSGEITFREFVGAMEQWVGADEEEEELEDNWQSPSVGGGLAHSPSTPTRTGGAAGSPASFSGPLSPPAELPPTAQ